MINGAHVIIYSQNAEADRAFIKDVLKSLEIRGLQKAGVECDTVAQQSWGRSTRIQLPGGGTLGLYEPRHQRP